MANPESKDGKARKKQPLDAERPDLLRQIKTRMEQITTQALKFAEAPFNVRKRIIKELHDLRERMQQDDLTTSEKTALRDAMEHKSGEAFRIGVCEDTVYRGLKAIGNNLPSADKYEALPDQYSYQNLVRPKTLV